MWFPWLVKIFLFQEQFNSKQVVLARTDSLIPIVIPLLVQNSYSSPQLWKKSPGPPESSGEPEWHLRDDAALEVKWRWIFNELDQHQIKRGGEGRIFLQNNFKIHGKWNPCNYKFGNICLLISSDFAHNAL